MSTITIESGSSARITIAQTVRPIVIRRPGVQGIQGIPGTDGKDGLDGVQSSDGSVTDIIALTQAEYEALDPVSATTFYIITD